jgi:hypothetical protein
LRFGRARRGRDFSFVLQFDSDQAIGIEDFLNGLGTPGGVNFLERGLQCRTIVGAERNAQIVERLHDALDLRD